MRKGISRRVCAASMALAVFAWPAAAHHGGDVEWADKPVGPITGTATKFAFQFPHVFFEMDVPQDGAVAKWTMTTRWTPTILRDHGWSRESLRAGDKVTVTYLPHIEKARIGQMVTIEVNGRELPLSF
jgi:hypothetical protein